MYAIPLLPQIPVPVSISLVFLGLMEALIQARKVI